MQRCFDTWQRMSLMTDYYVIKASGHRVITGYVWSRYRTNVRWVRWNCAGGISGFGYVEWVGRMTDGGEFEPYDIW